MPQQKEDRDFRKIVVQPFECKIDADFLDESELRLYPFILMIDPVIADLARQDLSSKSTELWILRSGSHILKILEATIFRDMIWIKRFKQDAAGKLRRDQVSQPGGSASGCASN